MPAPSNAVRSSNTARNETNNSSKESTRLSKTTACLPLVYGSIAFYLGKKADEFQTHEWTLFLRGPNNEDLSAVISKVAFQLHASFAQPIRELTQPPFEVTERGWGEFEAQIKIVWKDPTEKPTLFNHGIKLYPPGQTAQPNSIPTNEDVKPVIAENYDEVVFTDPHEQFYRQLMRISVAPKAESSQDEHLIENFRDENDFLALIGAQKFLSEELSKVKERFQVVSDELLIVDQDLLVARQKAQQREAATKKVKGGGGKRGQSKKARTS